MKNALLIICFLSLSIQAQEKEFKPEYPFNFKDTLLVIKNINYIQKPASKKIISFVLKDDNWNCKEISFTHFLFREGLKENIYGNTVYVERNMDKRNFTKKELKDYKSITFSELKNYSKKNKGCNNLESFLKQPTIYFIIKDNNKYIGYEVLPIVWGVTDD